jgi:hypothetical protein
VAGALVVVVVAGALVVVVVAGALVVVVVAGALGCLVFTLVVDATWCHDRWLANLAPEAPRTAEDLTVARALLLIAKELTVAPELLLTAEELTSAASATATTIPPARARRR